MRPHEIRYIYTCIKTIITMGMLAFMKIYKVMLIVEYAYKNFHIYLYYRDTVKIINNVS